MYRLGAFTIGLLALVTMFMPSAEAAFAEVIGGLAQTPFYESLRLAVIGAGLSSVFWNHA